MTEMVERVARALFEHENAGAMKIPGDNGWDGPIFGERGREMWRKSARAAIAAMRYPSDEMIQSVGSDWGFALEDQWNKMIDEALK